MSETLDPETARKIRAWLIGEGHREEKFAALEMLWMMHVTGSRAHGVDLDAGYAEIARRLGFPRSEYEKPLSPARRYKSLRRVALRVAAVLAPIIMIAAAALLWPGGENASVVETLAVRTGGESGKFLTLPDGSTVSLAAGARISYDNTFAEGRAVHLSGEALFDVAPLADDEGEPLPFTVSTDRVKVNVLGTVFRVLDPIESESSRIALYEGRVSVDVEDATVELNRGEELHYSPYEGCSVRLIPASEMLERGYRPSLRFDNSSLGDLIAALRANFDIEFVVPHDTDLSEGAFTADFEGEPLDETIGMLSRSSRMYHFVRSDDKIFVRRK